MVGSMVEGFRRWFVLLFSVDGRVVKIQSALLVLKMLYGGPYSS